MMKRVVAAILVCGLLFAGCAKSQNSGSENVAPTDELIATEAATNNTVETEAVRKIQPLPDVTMENLTDAILAITLKAGDAYYNEYGVMQMTVTVHAYDQYDMVDIANLNVGDILVRHSGDMEVTSKEQNEAGTIFINGGFDNDGIDLVTDDSGVFYEVGYNDSKNWYEAGTVTLQLADHFTGIDNADLDYRDLLLTHDSLMMDNIINYDFTPYNTTIRVENGKVVEMERRYTP